MKKLLGSLFLAALVLGAAEITGKWSGNITITYSQGETRNATAFLVLKQNGQEVTGTVGPNADKQAPIRNGKLDGDKLTFDVEHSNGGVMKFDLTVDGETISGNVQGKAEHGEEMTAKLSVKRTT